MYSQSMAKETGGIKSYSNLLKYTVLGAIISIFASIILMFIFSFAVNGFFDDPTQNLNVFTGIATSVGAFIGGRYAAAHYSSRGLLCGLITGALTSLAAFFTYILFKTPGVGEYFVFYIANILFRVIFACVGGISAVQKKKSKPHGKSLKKK